MVDHLPAYPEPPSEAIEQAKRVIPELLSGTTSPFVAADLVRALQKRGHIISAGHWAIHRLIEAGLLTAEYRANFVPSYSGTTESGTPFVCVGETIPSKTGPSKFASFTLKPTDALWEWWRKNGGEQAPKNENIIASEISKIKPNSDLPTGEQTHGSDDNDQLLSATKICERLGIPASDNNGRDKIRKKLDAWRKANFGGGWIETRNPRPRNPKYLYPLGKIWPVVSSD